MPPHRYCTLECHYDTWKRSPIFSQSMIRLLETVDQRSPTRNSNLYFLVRDLQIATLLHANFPISVSFLFSFLFFFCGKATRNYICMVALIRKTSFRKFLPVWVALTRVICYTVLSLIAVDT